MDHHEVEALSTEVKAGNGVFFVIEQGRSTRLSSATLGYKHYIIDINSTTKCLIVNLIGGFVCYANLSKFYHMFVNFIQDNRANFSVDVVK